MSEKFACPECGQLHRWKPEFAGKRAKCKCGGVITVPDQPSAPAAPPAMEQAPLGLADDAGSAASFDAVSPGGCPACGAAIADGAVLCVACGYNQQTGQQIGTAVETAPPPGAAPRALPPMPHGAKAEPAHSGSNLNKSAFGTIGVGVLVLAWGVYEYHDITSWETSGIGVKKVHKWVKFGYEMGGAKGVLILFLIVAILFFVIGYLQLIGKISSGKVKE